MTAPQSKTMRAAVLTGHGGLEKLEYRDDVPVPEPGPEEVLIKVGACGMNNTDINARAGWYAPAVREGTTEELGREGVDRAQLEETSWDRGKMNFPRIQGPDIAGRIVAVGEGVGTSRIGERVLVDFWFRAPGALEDIDRTAFIGSDRDGGFADYVAVPSRNAVAIDTPLTDAELATFPCAYTTAENMLTRARLSGAEAVVITGASGGVGSALIQLARRRDARVVAIASRSKARQVSEIGADTVIPRETSDLAAAVTDALGGRPLDVVADVVGGPSFPQLLAALRRGGRYVTSGAIAGPVVELDLRVLYLNDLEMHGGTVIGLEVFPNLVKYIEAGEICPLLDRTYPLSQIREAQTYFLQKSHVGNIALIPDDG